MKDFNFFEPYLDKDEFSRYNILILYIVALVVVLGLITYPLVNIFRINSLNKQIGIMKSNLESDKVSERLNTVKQKKETVSEMEERLSLLENVDKIIEGRNVIDDMFLSKITDQVPKEVFLSSLDLSANQIRVQGSATNSLAIAHFESNLKSEESFEEIYIPNISLKEGLYNFSINFTLKGAEEDDAEQDNAEQDDAEQNDAEKTEKDDTEELEQGDVE